MAHDTLVARLEVGQQFTVVFPLNGLRDSIGPLAEAVVGASVRRPLSTMDPHYLRRALNQLPNQVPRISREAPQLSFRPSTLDRDV